MNAFLDIMTVGVLVASILLAMKKGLAKSIIEFIGFIASIIIAAALRTQVGTLVYTAFVKPLFVDTATNKINDLILSNAKDAINGADVSQAVSKAPQDLMNIMNQFGISLDSVKSVANGKAAEGAAIASKAIAESIVDPIAHTLSMAIAFFIVFTVCMIIVRVLSGLLGNVFNIPILGTANRLGGAVFGLLRGFVIVCIIGALVTFIMPLTNPEKSASDTIGSTVTYKYIDKINPISQYFVK